MRAFLCMLFCGLLLAVTVVPTAGQGRTPNTLTIYVVDVEGGNATLVVAPSGESLLIDTGNGGAVATRDADRIMAAVSDAGLTQLNHLVTTHYHGDHYGAMEEVITKNDIVAAINVIKDETGRSEAEIKKNVEAMSVNGVSERTAYVKLLQMVITLASNKIDADIKRRLMGFAVEAPRDGRVAISLRMH